MRRANLTIAFVLLAVLSGAQAHAQDKRIELKDGSFVINLLLPAGLEPFPDERMAALREKGVAAKFAFGDPQGDVMLTINIISGGDVADEKGLSKVVAQIKAAAERNLRVESFKRDFFKINGDKWLRLTFKATAGADSRVETYFMTPWAGEYVLFNYSSTIAKYESYKSVFERSARSIELAIMMHTIANEDEPKRPPGKPRR
ncbi:MAG TPA: hypothetical protein VGA87_10680 [Pyrinomonadaceae bacterium]|jgi:hypothetical protein